MDAYSVRMKLDLKEQVEACIIRIVQTQFLLIVCLKTTLDMTMVVAYIMMVLLHCCSIVHSTGMSPSNMVVVVFQISILHHSLAVVFSEVTNPFLEQGFLTMNFPLLS